jgi:hypothetical protein
MKFLFLIQKYIVKNIIMSFDLEKEILNLEEEIIEDETQLNNINKLYDKIPKEKFFNNKNSEKNIKEKINSLISTSNIITKLEKINDISNPIEKLNSIISLFKTETISNSFLKKYIINELVTNDILKLIEESLLNIKYPIFQGKILMTIFEQINNDKRQDIEILSLYFQLYSILVTDMYKEFTNFNRVDELIKKNSENNNIKKCKFIEILSEFIFKKILATIFDEKNEEINTEIQRGDENSCIKKLNPEDKKIYYKYEKLILYINKAISNTSELISLISSQINGENKENNMNKNIMMKFFISNLFEKLILFSLSEKSSFEINNSSRLLIVLLINKTKEQMNEFNNNYKYDSLNNISFYDFICYYTSKTEKEKDIIKGQKDFIENIVQYLKKDILNEKIIELNKTEEILEYFSLIIKDIISIFETFRTKEIIDKLLKTSCQNVLNIFKDVYQNKIYALQNKIKIENILFMTNLLYNFSLICTNEFDFFLERINSYDEAFKNDIKDILDNFKKEVKDLYKNYKGELLLLIKFEKIIQLFNYQNLKEGNSSENIKNTFDEENKFWLNINITFDKIQANKDLVKNVIGNAAKNLIKDLSNIVLNNIEKSDIEGKNLDVLIEKTKFFLENNFKDEDIDEESQKNKIKLFSYLDNLYMNKK